MSSFLKMIPIFSAFSPRFSSSKTYVSRGIIHILKTAFFFLMWLFGGECELQAKEEEDQIKTRVT